MVNQGFIILMRWQALSLLISYPWIPMSLCDTHGMACFLNDLWFVIHYLQLAGWKCPACLSACLPVSTSQYFSYCLTLPFLWLLRHLIVKILLHILYGRRAFHGPSSNPYMWWVSLALIFFLTNWQIHTFIDWCCWWFCYPKLLSLIAKTNLFSGFIWIFNYVWNTL